MDQTERLPDGVMKGICMSTYEERLMVTIDEFFHRKFLELDNDTDVEEAPVDGGVVNRINYVSSCNDLFYAETCSVSKALTSSVLSDLCREFKTDYVIVLVAYDSSNTTYYSYVFDRQTKIRKFPSIRPYQCSFRYYWVCFHIKFGYAILLTLITLCVVGIAVSSERVPDSTGYRYHEYHLRNVTGLVFSIIGLVLLPLVFGVVVFLRVAYRWDMDLVERMVSLNNCMKNKSFLVLTVNHEVIQCWPFSSRFLKSTVALHDGEGRHFSRFIRRNWLCTPWCFSPPSYVELQSRQDPAPSDENSNSSVELVDHEQAGAATDQQQGNTWPRSNPRVVAQC